MVPQRESHRFLLTLALCGVAYWFSRPFPETETVKYGIISRTSHAGLGFYLKEGVPDEFSPRLVWLMGFPQSGEDYVMTNTEHVSNKSPASNYGPEITTADQPNSISVYPRHPEGPFWEGLGVEKKRTLPQNLVLTKTYCGGYCLECSPEDYVLDADEFMVSVLWSPTVLHFGVVESVLFLFGLLTLSYRCHSFLKTEPMPTDSSQG